MLFDTCRVVEFSTTLLNLKYPRPVSSHFYHRYPFHLVRPWAPSFHQTQTFRNSWDLSLVGTRCCQSSTIKNLRFHSSNWSKKFCQIHGAVQSFPGQVSSQMATCSPTSRWSLELWRSSPKSTRAAWGHATFLYHTGWNRSVLSWQGRLTSHDKRLHQFTTHNTPDAKRENFRLKLFKQFEGFRRNQESDHSLGMKLHSYMHAVVEILNHQLEAPGVNSWILYGPLLYGTQKNHAFWGQ